ncbi:MAG: metallo-mystery pair system four-Cys motif protein [Zoogloeaceae bacterium]|nr:metallo-mystery pair system four-Cys motif protein [Zoogloeaceae bacterium]
MKNKPAFKAISTYVLSGVAFAVLSACGGGGSNADVSEPTQPEPRAVSIQFAGVAGTAPVSCSQPVAALGSGALQSELKDFRFYVSEVSLKRADGSFVPLAMSIDDWQHESAVALIDLEDGTGSCAGRGTAGMNASIRGTVPGGDYVGVRMTVGVPSAVNHSDTAASAAPLDSQAMAWSWQAGRKFAKIEIAPTGGVTRPANPDTTPPTPETSSAIFNVHVGSTGCTGNPASGEIVNCAASNRLALEFDSFNVDTQQVLVDLQPLFLSSNTGVDLGGPFGCMSGKTDPECAAMFEALGLDLASGLTVNGGRNQSVFRIGAR